MYSRDGKNRNHSGEGHLVSNLITFVIFFVVLLLAFYSTSWWELDNLWRAWLPTIGIIGGGGVLVYGGAMALCRRTSHHPDIEANEAAQAAQVDAEYAQALRESSRRH